MKDINILIFGDSITYGAWDKENGGWVNRLRLALENKSEAYFNIYNLGIPGETTIDLKKRFDNECNYRFNTNDKTIIIFSIGINDSQTIKGKNNVLIKEFKKNVVELIDKAKQYTPYILFIGLTKVDENRTNPVSWDNNINYSNEEVIKYNEVLKNICKEKVINYLEIFNLLDIKDLDDGLHPNNNGHQKLCEEILKYLQDNYI